MTIKELREETGFTQKEFSDYFGVPRRTLEDWESGKGHCADYVLRLIEYKINKEENIMTKREMAEIICDSPAWDGYDNADDMCSNCSYQEIKDAYDMLSDAEADYYDSLYE